MDRMFAGSAPVGGDHSAHTCMIAGEGVHVNGQRCGFFFLTQEETEMAASCSTEVVFEQAAEDLVERRSRPSPEAPQYAEERTQSRRVKQNDR